MSRCIPVADKNRPVYAMCSESLDQARDLTGRVRSQAARTGRTVRFSVSFRPILVATEDAAWRRAQHILEETRRLRAAQGYSRGGPQQSESRQAPARCRRERRALSTGVFGPKSPKKLALAPTPRLW
jgi:alkanesulfonate monooxygenase SsuD/methylene tetrahydromethanopterin reductase-like flavin-dependent oxidoreductase (luciferase family)